VIQLDEADTDSLATRLPPLEAFSEMGAGCVDFSLSDTAAVQRIKHLPKEVGVMLLSVGVLGFALPGIMGTPAIIAGGLVLWPKAFGKVEDWFERRYPSLHRRSMQQIERYLEDLERRYPNATR
jgi:hypothetical protein